MAAAVAGPAVVVHVGRQAAAAAHADLRVLTPGHQNVAQLGLHLAPPVDGEAIVGELRHQGVGGKLVVQPEAALHQRGADEGGAVVVGAEAVGLAVAVAVVLRDGDAPFQHSRQLGVQGLPGLLDLLRERWLRGFIAGENGKRQRRQQ